MFFVQKGRNELPLLNVSSLKRRKLFNKFYSYLLVYPYLLLNKPTTSPRGAAEISNCTNYLFFFLSSSLIPSESSSTNLWTFIFILYIKWCIFMNSGFEFYQKQKFQQIGAEKWFTCAPNIQPGQLLFLLWSGPRCPRCKERTLKWNEEILLLVLVIIVETLQLKELLEEPADGYSLTRFTINVPERRSFLADRKRHPKPLKEWTARASSSSSSSSRRNQIWRRTLSLVCSRQTRLDWKPFLKTVKFKRSHHFPICSVKSAADFDPKLEKMDPERPVPFEPDFRRRRSAWCSRRRGEETSTESHQV